jgi:hypothetical protein
MLMHQHLRSLSSSNKSRACRILRAAAISLASLAIAAPPSHGAPGALPLIRRLDVTSATARGDGGVAYWPRREAQSTRSLAWNTFLGGAGDDRFGGPMTVDASGNVYLSGASSATWGSPVRTHTGDGERDAFVAKLDSAGNVLWITFLGGPGDDHGKGIAVDGSGDVYVAGSGYGSWGTPVRAHSGGTGADAFAAKLSSGGVLIWSTFLGGSVDGSYSDSADDIAVDGSGTIYVAGTSGGTWGTPVRAHDGDSDTFVARLDAAGNLTWNTFLGGPGGDFWGHVAVDQRGRVYVAGCSPAAWGNPIRTDGGAQDGFVARLDAAGNLIWNTFLGGAVIDTGAGITVDGSGDVYVAGISYGTWGTPVRVHGGGTNVYAAKLTPGGALTWNTFLGGGDEGGWFLAVDGRRHVYVGGQSHTTWGSPGRPYSGGEWDAFATELDPSGNLLWSTFLGGTGYDGGVGIAVDGRGNVYAAGMSDATWANPIRPHSGDWDAWVAKLAADAQPGTPEPTPVASNTPGVTPTPGETPGVPTCVCRSLAGRVPPVVIADALANPSRYYGWMLPLDPGKPPSRFNLPRRCLSLQNPSVSYHPQFNAVQWRVGCP